MRPGWFGKVMPIINSIWKGEKSQPHTIRHHSLAELRLIRPATKPLDTANRNSVRLHNIIQAAYDIGWTQYLAAFEKFFTADYSFFETTQLAEDVSEYKQIH